MNRLISVLFICLAIGTAGCSTGRPGNPDSLEERASYAMGFTLGQNLDQQGAEIDTAQLAQGLRDAMSGQPPRLTPDDMQAAMFEYQTMLADAGRADAEELGAENRAAGEAFLAENAEREEVVVLDSGLQYEVIEEGYGASPTADDEVTVHYRGTLIDGTQFDSSYDKGTPTTFPLNQVIPGWTEGVQLMKVGARYRFFIPGDLGYGPDPAPGEIGPNATLIFDVELLEINGQS